MLPREMSVYTIHKMTRSFMSYLSISSRATLTIKNVYETSIIFPLQ